MLAVACILQLAILFADCNYLQIVTFSSPLKKLAQDLNVTMRCHIVCISPSDLLTSWLGYFMMLLLGMTLSFGASGDGVSSVGWMNLHIPLVVGFILGSPQCISWVCCSGWSGWWLLESTGFCLGSAWKLTFCCIGRGGNSLAELL